MLTRGKVVLFYPAYDGPPLSAPLCLLSLAATLRAADFEVVLIDAAIEPNWEQRVLKECVNALCVGISVLTGPMIGGAIQVSTAVKRLYPEMPVVFGGWHSSLLPSETLNEWFVDAVVRGQGEVTLLELASALAASRCTISMVCRGRAMVCSTTTRNVACSPWNHCRLRPSIWWTSTPMSAHVAFVS